MLKTHGFPFLVKSFNICCKGFVVCVWIFLIKLAVDHQASDCKYLVFLYTHISRQ